MNRKKKYAAPVITLVTMDSTAILAGSGSYDEHKLTGKSEDDQYPPLEYGGEGGGTMYDPD